LFKEQQFIKVLPAGVHKVWDWFDQYQVQIVTLTNTLQEEMSKDLLHIAQLHPEAFAEVMTQWETGEQEVGLVYQKNVLKDIKAPGQQRGAYWKTQENIHVDKMEISEEFTVPKTLAALLANSKDDLLRRAALPAIVAATVPENHL